MTDLDNIMVKNADRALKIQLKDGSFPAGHNGPWKNKDTPVRITAHQTLVLLETYKMTKQPRYKLGAMKSAKYLIDSFERHGGHAFRCCESSRKEIEVNGLIGQAWAVEALLAAGSVLKSKEALRTAETVLQNHCFDTNLGLWNMHSKEGESLGINHSMNQQVWFALMHLRAGRALKNKTLLKRYSMFMDRLPRTIRRSGKIMDMWIDENVLIGQPHQYLLRKVQRIRKRKQLWEESIGYLSFTLLGLALIRKEDPQGNVWRDDRIIKLIANSLEEANKKHLPAESMNRFMFRYNMTGFEMACAIGAFTNRSTEDKSLESAWINKQLDLHLDRRTGLLDVKVSDKRTVPPRIYEASYLKRCCP
ncbi:hypothetical protein JW711_05690 [Candidatus Woesearchaeota archaeon]|nr:hypothetical protein [Candidatus Woesearchaeota archaeon]